MMRPDAKVEKVYPYPNPVDFRKSIDGLAAPVELDIKVAVFDPVLLCCSTSPGSRVKFVLGAQRFLPLAKAVGVRALQNIAGLFG